MSNCLEPSPGEIEMAVKMRPTCCRTKRPRGALLQLDIELNLLTVENRRETSVASEIPLFDMFSSHLRALDRVQEQCLVGSLTGEVAC